VSELYEKASIIITSNKGVDAWAEMMGDDYGTARQAAASCKGIHDGR